MLKTNMPSTVSLLPVILAGGNGSRLWPLSRHSYAKQYLALGSAETLLQSTLSRLDGLKHFPPVIICSEDTRFMAAEQLREIDMNNATIILEPVGRNTAPAIALAALKAVEHGADPVMIIMPSDHRISNQDAFKKYVEKAADFADQGFMVTFGIKPNHPSTEYGYIEYNKKEESDGAFTVASFIEKPNKKTAEQYIKGSKHVWNSGIFLFKANQYLNELGKYQPKILTACKEAFDKQKTDLDFVRIDETAFKQSPSLSIDYAVMEHTDTAIVIPVDFGWSDIGSWSALWDISEKDADGNSVTGDILSINSNNNYLHSENRLIATVGLSNMIVIETKDAILVSPKSEAHLVRDIVAKLESHNRSEATSHREVYRPWGKYDSIDQGERYQVKRITVKPGAKLSVQKHHHRAEHWIVVRGIAKVTKGSETIMLSENQSTYIPLGEIHALENPGHIPLELIEVQSGSYLGEDDIIRIEDKYGRE